MGLLDNKKVVSREKRLSTITAYLGNSITLYDDMNVSEVRQRIRTFSQGCNDEIIEALKLLSRIKEAPVIIHGAAGCSVSELFFIRDMEDFTWYSTDLNEKDTIMGGDLKLKKTILRVYRKYKPEVIFVVSTPIVAINNDDVNSVIKELQDELDVKIISVNTNGFQSKAGINGIDIILHAIGRELLQSNSENKKEDYINLISITENENSIYEISRLLSELDIKVNLIPRFHTIDPIKKAHLAKASIAVNDDEADILLQILSEKADVPVIKSNVPIGIIGTQDWLNQMGKMLNIQDKIKAFTAKEEHRIEKYVSKQPLRGKKVFIDASTCVAVSLAGFIDELGGTVTGISIDHVDMLNRDLLKKLPENLLIKVGEGQLFELVNILRKDKPDYYVGSTFQAREVSKLGILPVSLDHKILYGYEGALELIQSFQKADRRKHLTDYLSDHTQPSYTQSWLSKNPNWYIKQEVK